MTNIDQFHYSVLRFGGTPEWRACAELGVSSGRGVEFEERFRSSGAGGGMRPRFARHDLHVAAVRAAGGYPAIRP